LQALYARYRTYYERRAVSLEEVVEREGAVKNGSTTLISIGGRGLMLLGSCVQYMGILPRYCTKLV